MNWKMDLTFSHSILNIEAFNFSYCHDRELWTCVVKKKEKKYVFIWDSAYKLVTLNVKSSPS